MIWFLRHWFCFVKTCNRNQRLPTKRKNWQKRNSKQKANGRSHRPPNEILHSKLPHSISKPPVNKHDQDQPNLNTQQDSVKHINHQTIKPNSTPSTLTKMISPFPISPSLFWYVLVLSLIIYQQASLSFLILMGAVDSAFSSIDLQCGPQNQVYFGSPTYNDQLGTTPPCFARLTSSQIPSLITCSATNQRCKRDGGPWCWWMSWLCLGCMTSICLVGDCFTVHLWEIAIKSVFGEYVWLFTMVNYHVSPPFGEHFFSNNLKQI